MRLFTVQACATTGQWIEGTLTEIGTIDKAEHLSKTDTADVHYDTFEHNGETCAVEVHWVYE